MVLRDKRRTRSTSCTLYDCIAACEALPLRRLASRLGRFLDALRRLARPELRGRRTRRFGLLEACAQASIRSMTLPVSGLGVSEIEISCPSTFFWIAASIRPRTSSR
jgi:hypothetical protein